MEITPKLINKLATLARLEFDEKGYAQIMNDLNQMLAFVEKLQMVNTDGIEPLVHLSENENLLRQDIAEIEIFRNQALINAPLHDGRHIKVPKVIK